MVRIEGFAKTQNRIRRHRVRYEDEEIETTPMDKRGNLLWEVRANALSLDVPVCLWRKRQVVDDHGPTPKRYKKETRLNTFTIIVNLEQTKNHVAQFV